MYINLLFITISIVFSLPAMEGTTDSITVIDYNNNEAVRFQKETSVVGVFGGTIRYSAYEQYTNTLAAHYSSLVDQYKRNKRLKGIPQSTRTLISSLAQSPGLDEVAKHIETSQKSFKLFFAAGFEHKELKDHVSILLKTIQKKYAEIKAKNIQAEPVLMHILLPSYFADLTHLKDQDQAPERLYAFLQESASFFKQFYQENSDNSLLQVYVVIPPLSYFIEMIQSPKPASNVDGNPIELLEANCNVLHATLIEPLKCQKYLFFDQDSRDAQPMVECLAQKGVKPEKIACIRIPITNQMGYPSTIFLPYILKRGKEYVYQTSPLFCKELENYFKEVKGHDE